MGWRDRFRRTPRVPSSTGPDEPTVRLARYDFARRRHQGRRRLLRHVALVVVVALVVGLGAWAVLFSSLLTARGAEVVGAGDLSPSRVESAADVPTGTPLARVDVGAIRTRVEAIPGVRSADVSRSWPHTVHIEVTPRTPVAVLERGDTLRALDADGVVFGSYAKRPRGLPLVEAAASADDEALVEAAGVVASLPEDVAARTATVEVGSVDEISLVLTSGRRVVWGSAEQSATKADVLAVVLPKLPKDVEEIDVSVPGRLTTR
ncbi:cell division protein FtsQ [Nocardioides scoriae]|uniref:Cell division protein FtsQ n=1 Tax=Nocardioides scoriae TaxID=642780 RepID=A0A1H1L7Q8_9ACTN|nr:FtsQ-type POTRA domain-containing protein [Nocardioides scoriae]SDR70568.1 cell division protein FtsQ [Nocardioides scoriae]